MTRLMGLLALTSTLVIGGCDALGQALSAHTNVVARAANHELTVDEVVAMLARNPRLPADPQIVSALADLWIDYTLLATVVAQDPELERVDLSGMIEPEAEQQIVWKLREEVINVDTTFSEEELRASFAQEQPGLQVRARHILLQYPTDASPAQRDSVWRTAAELRERAAAGEDFATLARRYSQDRGSAEQGGDLGAFGKGQMVESFEDAAFALGVGEVSEPVESVYGVHIIQVAERFEPSFDDLSEWYREQKEALLHHETEERYIDELTSPLQPRVQPDALEVVREIAMRPGVQLGGRASSRALVSFRGGALTAGDFQRLAQRMSQRARGDLAMAPDEDLEAFLLQMTQNHLLVREAKRRGLDLTAAERDSLNDRAKRYINAVAAQAGLQNIEPQEGETREEAIRRKVMSLMTEIVSNERNIIPLGPVAFNLRREYGAQILERSFAAVIEQIDAERADIPEIFQRGQMQQGLPQQVAPPREQRNDN